MSPEPAGPSLSVQVLFKFVSLLLLFRKARQLHEDLAEVAQGYLVLMMWKIVVLVASTEGPLCSWSLSERSPPPSFVGKGWHFPSQGDRGCGGI